MKTFSFSTAIGSFLCVTLEKVSAFCLLSILAFQSPCYAGITKLSAEHRKLFQDVSGFRQIYMTADLPASILVLCGSKLADPGQNWERSDVVRDESLAGKRLIWAAANGEYYVVHYESGGKFYRSQVMLATVKEGDNALLLWYGVGGPFKDFNEFLDALNTDQIDDHWTYTR